ncbi:MAG: mandelate racemase/muconate lactonizing enzyme family protein, partial [Candidatus Poribacteria bacterium]
YFVNFTERGNAISVNPIEVENGYIHLPTSPGLGLELDEKALSAFPYREFPKRHLRQFHEEGP